MYTPPSPVYVDIALPRQARVSSRRRHRSAPSSYAPKLPDDYFKHSLLKKLKALKGSDSFVPAMEEIAATSIVDLIPFSTPDLICRTPLWLWDLMLQEDALSEGVARVTSPADRILLEVAVSEWRRGLSFRELATVLNSRGHLSREMTPFNAASARNLVIQGLLCQASVQHRKHS